MTDPVDVAVEAHRDYIAASRRKVEAINALDPAQTKEFTRRVVAEREALDREPPLAVAAAPEEAPATGGVVDGVVPTVPTEPVHDRQGIESRECPHYVMTDQGHGPFATRCRAETGGAVDDVGEPACSEHGGTLDLLIAVGNQPLRSCAFAPGPGCVACDCPLADGGEVG